MKLIRPLAGAVLLTLLLAPGVSYADRVIDITPGGSASLLPPGGGSDGGDRSAAVEILPGSTPRPDTPITGGGRGDSEREGGYQVDVQPTLQTRHFGGQVNLTCRVASSSRDLVVINHGLEPLPPGTRIKWQLKDEGKRGYFAIINELGGGESLVADDVLDGRAQQDEACIARVI